MAEFFRFQARTFVAEAEAERVRLARIPLEAIGDRIDWQALWDRTVRLSAFGMTLALEALLAEAVDIGIVEANIELVASFSLENPRALQWVLDHAAEAIRGINATTAEAINAIVADGIAAGESYGTVAKAIAEQLRAWATPDTELAVRSRAHLIAVTEMGNGYVQGNRMVGLSLAAAGLAMEKAWLTAEDEKVCPVCEPNEAQGWIPFDEPFASGDDAPLAHPACRCDLLQRVAGTTSAGDAGEGRP